MKKICVLIISLFWINTLYAQIASYELIKENGLLGSIETYITKKGDTIKLNDQLTVGRAYNFDTYKFLDNLYLRKQNKTSSEIQRFKLREAAEGFVLIVDRIIAENGVVGVYSKINSESIPIFINDIDAAIVSQEILLGLPSKKYPYYYKDSLVGYYTNQNFSPMRIYFTNNIPDSLIKNEFQSIASNTIVNNKVNFSKKELNASFYLKQAGNTKNAALAVGGLSLLIGGLMLSSSDPNNPDSNFSATPILVVGGVVSLILNVLGNNALVKAGDAIELEKIKEFEAKNNDPNSPKL
jgi:hypothetical protein